MLAKMTHDVAVPAAGYPVLARVPLERPLRPFRTNRVRARVLPRQRAHAGVVLDVEGELVAVPAGRPVFRTKGFTRATAAIYVDLTPYDGEVTLPAPSADAAAQFSVTVRFRCTVVDAHAVLAARIGDVGETLVNWSTNVVRAVSASYPLAAERELERQLHSTLRQQLSVAPPFPPGALRCELATVWVGVTVDLRHLDDAGAGRRSATLEVLAFPGAGGSAAGASADGGSGVERSGVERPGGDGGRPAGQRNGEREANAS